tara:strand:- start:10096 stop:10860 length:765 start_codon:yes stop_codon:yes gene_type:complete
MNIPKNLIYIFLFFFTSCADYKGKRIDITHKKQFYSSKGFALIYDNNLYDQGLINKKIDNNEIIVLHSTLKKNSQIKLVNPDNSEMILSKIYKRAEFPSIFKVVISKKVANILQLDLENPYIEIYEIQEDSVFIAKEGKIYDEEKNVANKAPVEKIEIDDLSSNSSNTTELKKEKSKKINNFILMISDFYYLESADNLKNELAKKTKFNSFAIKKIKNNKYRLYAGPFKNFNSLKSTYISLNKLGFDDLEVYRE